MQKSKNILSSYKLPWTESDNPNGWIEPTNTCNIICPGCYRGAEKAGIKTENLSLDELKKQIDWFKKNRNIHTVSIAGGEPTLYPHLRELIAYAAQQNLRTMLFSNGLLLTPELATELAEIGLTQVVIHVDRFQQRPDMKDITAIALRQQFVDRLKNIPNLQLGFIQPISQTCEAEVEALMAFTKKNFSHVNLMVFTIYRNICESSEFKTEIENNMTIPDLLHTIQKYSDIEPAAYLKSLSDSKIPTWLFTQQMGINDVILGNVSSGLYKLAHQNYRAKNNRHLFISRKNTVKVLSLFAIIYRLPILKILSNYISHALKTGNWNKGTINFQTFLLLRGPEKQMGKWDLCDGCPDRMIYNGKIVPSCILENIKQKENSNFNDAII